MERQTKEKEPLVSFVIAYYDLPARLLRECIESILALSLSEAEREIIVIDDGSRESPLQALADVSNHLLYIRQSHSGLSVARNTGLKVACGQYIQFVDADDRLIQPPYEHCLDVARFERAEVVMFQLTEKDESDTREYHDAKPLSGAELMRLQNIRGSACGYLFSRAILGNQRFTPDIYNEDEEFTPLLLLRAERVVDTDAQAYYYQHRPESIITSTNIRKRLKRLNDTKGVILRLYRYTSVAPVEAKGGLQRRVAQLTMDYLYRVIRETRSRRYLDKRIKELRQQGVYPLPDRDYTHKYTWFRRFIDSPAGRTILMRLIPLIPKER